jgi:hypothetical protein
MNNRHIRQERLWFLDLDQLIVGAFENWVGTNAGSAQALFTCNRAASGFAAELCRQADIWLDRYVAPRGSAE